MPETFIAPHDVYWLYGATDEVLYIGCTHKLERRLDQHSRQMEWWPQVNRVEVESYPNRAAARVAESEAIRNALPLFNKHVPRKRVPFPPIIRRDTLVSDGASA